MASRAKPTRRAAPAKRSKPSHRAAHKAAAKVKLHRPAKAKPGRHAKAKKTAVRRTVVKQVRLAGHRGHGARINIHTTAKHNRLRTASLHRQHLTVHKTRRV